MWIIVLLISTISFILLLSLVAPFFTGAMWSPTPMKTVRRMLEMAGVKPGEKVYDLGSGDGRIVIIAAKEFRATSVGIEINPLLASLGKLKIRGSKIGNSVKLIRGNLYKHDIKDADVVAVFLSPQGNRKLKEKLEHELKQGVRIVSHRWQFKEWKPVEVDEKYKVYLYVMGESNKIR